MPAPLDPLLHLLHLPPVAPVHSGSPSGPIAPPRPTAWRSLPVRLCVGLGGLALGAGLVAGVAHAATDTQAPGRGERPVIVAVEGDPANGFTLTYADGATLSPPTDSESVAECSEYDRRLDRVRCRVEVRTWYRDLGDLRDSLAYVRDHPTTPTR
ncbi:hypothetical protein [Nocardioides sp.]|uniref:hypothetical protein n=1 Tax=Nocardioides sp. TaxID=35761 RepID=UPI00351129A3